MSSASCSNPDLIGRGSGSRIRFIVEPAPRRAISASIICITAAGGNIQCTFVYYTLVVEWPLESAAHRARPSPAESVRGRIPRVSAIRTRSARESARIFCMTCPR